MFTNITIGKYIYKDSLIHNIHPITKIISMFLFLIISLTSNFKQNIIIFVLCIIIIHLSKIDKKIYLKNIYGIRYLCISILIIDIIFNNNLLITLNDILKLLMAITISSIFMYTTNINEINYGLKLILKPLKYLKINVDQISIILTISIKFIDIVLDEVNNIYNAFKSRGLDFKGSLKEKILKLKMFLGTVFCSLLKKTDNISNLFEARNYDLKQFNVSSKINFSKVNFIILIFELVILLVIKKVI